MPKREDTITTIKHLRAATQPEAAALFGVTTQTIKNWYSVNDAPRGDDGKLDLPRLVKWRVEEAERRCVERAGGDPDLVGEMTPGLERLRMAKAQLAEADLAERRGETIRVKDLEPIHLAAARHIRGAGDKLQKQFGVEAWRILDEALENCERELTALPTPDERTET